MAQTVTDNAAQTRYELDVSGDRAGLIDYVTMDGACDLFHTEVDPQYAGQGLAAVLVAGAVADLRARGLALIPTCPYIQAWLRKNPTELDIVPPEVAQELGLIA